MKYAILSLICLTFLWSCNSSEVHEISNDTIEELSKALDLSFKNDSSYIDEFTYRLAEDLKNPYQSRYRFLFLAIYDIDSTYQDFFDKLEKHQKEFTPSQFYDLEKKQQLNFLKAELEKSDTAAISLFQKKYFDRFKSVGLRDDEVNKRIDNHLKFFKESLQINLSADLGSDLIYNLKLKMMKQKAIQHKKRLAYEFYELSTGSWTCGMEIRFPVFQPNHINLTQGDYLKGEIFVGTSESTYDWDRAYAVINQTDTVHFNGKLSTPYKTKISKKGKHTLNMQMCVFNTLTGEEIKSEYRYDFHVD